MVAARFKNRLVAIFVGQSPAVLWVACQPGSLAVITQHSSRQLPTWAAAALWPEL